MICGDYNCANCAISTPKSSKYNHYMISVVFSVKPMIAEI